MRLLILMQPLVFILACTAATNLLSSCAKDSSDGSFGSAQPVNRELPGTEQSTNPPPAFHLPAVPTQPTNAATLSAALKSAVASGTKMQISSTVIDGAALRNLYSARSYNPLFIDANGHLPLADSIRPILNDTSEANGLRSEDYLNNDIQSRLAASDLQTKLELELLLAQSTVSLTSDLNTGRTTPSSKDQNIADLEFGKRKFKDFGKLLNVLGQNPLTADKFTEFAPVHPFYSVLVAELARLNSAQKAGGWPAFALKKTLRPGQNDASVPAIRMRLADLGALTDQTQRINKSTSYDPELATAMRVFQDGAKLSADGVIGHTTVAALLIPLAARIDQVRANLERWRLLPQDFGAKYIFVNLGYQNLELFAAASQAGDVAPALSMKVVVGQESRETPSFIDQITDVIINPYWNAPPDIIVKDVLPKFAADPMYFSELHMRVFEGNREIDPRSVDWRAYNLEHLPPFTFREDSGPNNSLGTLKFNLSENSHSIYMHDTNHRELFAQNLRLFSSGCIRLEKPLELATYLLGADGYDTQDLPGLIADPRVVAQPIRLHTAWRVYVVDTTISQDRDNGALRFGPDVYQQDARLTEALNGIRSQTPSPQTVHNAAP